MFPVQIGVSCGIMQTGSGGGHLRRAYTILGDDVNLAARLMESAQPGGVLVCHGVKSLTGATFDWDVLPSIRVKGKRQAIQVASPRRARIGTAPRFSERQLCRVWPSAAFGHRGEYAFDVVP